MTNDPSHNELTSIDEPDGDVAGLLQDAYIAPAMPVSLLRRLDRQIAQEWGHSPELVQTPATLLQRSFSTGKRWFGAIPIATCAALMVAAVLMFGRESPAFAWSLMMQALEKQGLVKLDEPETSRWLSLSDGMLSERSPSSRVLLDVRHQVILERSSDATQIHRRKIPGQWKASDRDRLVLTFLLGNVASTSIADRLQGARLIKEDWEYIQQNGRKCVSLHVRWETNRSEQFDFRLTLDPLTRLPIACDLGAANLATTNAMTWSYPGIPVAELQSRDFPADYEVVDVDEHGEPIGQTAVAAANDSSEATAADESKQQTTSTEHPDVEDIRLADASPIHGAASQWMPVEVTSRTRDEVVQKINLILEDLWRTNQIDPAAPADDEELLRRVYLDLCGRTPSIHEIRSYLADKSANRYEGLVDRLLQNRDCASHLATIWRSFLIPEGVDLTAFGGVDAFDRWLAERFGNNDSYDSVVRSLLLAEGRLSRSGPLLFYSAAKLDPDLLAARSARVFLGMRLECAQCHDHPFEPWTQEEFWGFAAFFAQISRPRGELQAASTVMQVRDVDHGDVKIPKSDSIVPPKFLNSGNKSEQADNRTEPSESRRQKLARWLTAAENPYFCRATANRVWSIMFAKGIVDPVDDFGIKHQPKSSQLLELLAGHFANTKFDLRDLFRTIALSRAYRLSSGAATVDSKRSEWFAQMNVKTLSAEQVYDCITVATLLDTASNADPYSFNIARYGNAERDLFLQQFRTPTGRSTEYLGGIPQALTLMNGTLIDNATGLSKSGLLKSLEAPFFTNKQRVEVLYLATLSRHPRPSEWELLNGYMGGRSSTSDLRENLSDVLWALLNSAEFTMNH